MRRQFAHFPMGLAVAAGLLTCSLVSSVHAQRLTFSSDAEYTGSISAPGNNESMVVDNGAHLLFNGSWSNGFGGASTTWFLRDGARLTFGPDAQINNNMPDLVNARLFIIRGTGSGEIVDFDLGFRADHTGFEPHMAAAPRNYISHYGGDGTWANNALTTIRFGGLTVYTRTSENLATANKLGPQSGDLVHTDHGLIVFDQGSAGPTRWIVTDNDQSYPGGILWTTNWTLETITDLTYTGIFAERHKVTFGSRNNAVATVTKTGEGTLNINGTQAYAPGNTLKIEQGTVNFNFDPSWIDPEYSRWNWPESIAAWNNGQNLIVDVESDGTVSFNVRSGIQALSGEGTVAISLDSAGMAAEPFLRIREHSTFNGILKILNPGTLDLGNYALFAPGILTGDFQMMLPAGFEGTFDPASGSLTITAIPEPASLAMLALGGLLLTARRRA